MRTRLHDRPLGQPKGHWVTVGRIAWRKRLALVIGLLLLVQVLAVTLKTSSGEASAATTRAAVGYSCVSRNYTYTLRVAGTGLTIGRATWHATGCYWNNNSGVKSLSLTVDGYANAPYRYVGVIGSWTTGTTCSPASTCTHQSNHQVNKGKRVAWEFCALGSVGCQSVGTRAMQVNFDSYGNMWYTNA